MDSQRPSSSPTIGWPTSATRRLVSLQGFDDPQGAVAYLDFGGPAQAPVVPGLDSKIVISL